MKNYKQLTVAQRSKIEVLHLKKYSLTDIALTIGVDKSTVSREIKKRSTPNGYFADIAQINYEEKRENCTKPKILNNKRKLNHVISKLHKGWSPETISGRLKFKNANWNISTETIYQFIYEDDYCKQENLCQYLKQGKRRRTKWKGRKTKKDRIPNRVSIHERPAIVSYHVEFGHWEGDSVIYPNKKAINTLNELKTGYLEFSVLERKTAKLTAKAMIEKLSRHKSKTLTVDNGSEFTRHEIVAEATGVSIYFADPYASYQRGSNENSNGLLRRYLPKRKNIDKLAQEELDEIAEDLNNRPRKRLGFMTPAEAYQLELNNILSSVALGPRM